ncbi:hypothetical protein Mapa_008204 [Marchantia paleacea]|nr:hypothetical protein Mapa_008204 [Marchantia paleacea]
MAVPELPTTPTYGRAPACRNKLSTATAICGRFKTDKTSFAASTRNRSHVKAASLGLSQPPLEII